MTHVNPHAYNSAWQFRADAWCRLEQAGELLSTAAARGRDPAPSIDLVEGLLSQLRPFERYWAFRVYTYSGRYSASSPPALTTSSPGRSPRSIVRWSASPTAPACWHHRSRTRPRR